MKNDERQKRIAKIVSDIEKSFGKGSIMQMGEEKHQEIPTISTGSLSLNDALGSGGFPRGRVIEIFGPESSGKTTLALHAIAEAQKAGLITTFIDAEHALDINYAIKIGVDPKNLLLSQPDYGEQALEIADNLIRNNSSDLIVIDSVAALVPKAEIEGEMGDSHMGLQARLMSQALRKLTAITHKTNSMVIFINQVRNKIGVVYGNPETTTGGNALKFYASVRLEVRKADNIKQGENIIGNRIRVKVVKNKIAAPFKEVMLEVVYGEGINTNAEIVDIAAERGIITKSGTWYSYRDEQLGQGRENVIALLKQNSGLRDKIIKELFSTETRKAVA
ncbi:MAG: recombinase RecA [Deltaproteobacteria bacterium]|nr:recombinase RecA [Deltaproteobacteria bacterium]